MKKTLQSLLISGFALSVLVNLFFVQQVPSAIAADGIFKQVNFQGKLQNTDGTNVTDGDYTVVFTLYDASSAGNNLWDETQTVSTIDGIFRISLGSVDTTLGSVNFNSDSIYLGIKVGTDAEMTPRIRFTAVPYAFNAQKVNGLTVTNTSDNPFSSTTTLKIGDGKTVAINNGLTFSGTDGTTITFPNASGTVVTLDAAQTLTNKTIGSTGLVFSGATTDITTGTNEDFTLIPNGTGKIGLGTSTTEGLLNLEGKVTGKALAIFNEKGNQDIFTASASGTTRFTISNDGTAIFSNGSTAAPSIIFQGDSNAGFAYNASGISVVNDGAERFRFLTSSAPGLLFGSLGTQNTPLIRNVSNGTTGFFYPTSTSFVAVVH